MMKRLKNWLTKHLFNTVVDTDVFYSDGTGGLYLDGRKLSEGDIEALGRQVRDFKESDLYKILYGTVSSKAKKLMFVNSRVTDDIIAGKMMLMALDLHEKIMGGITIEYKKRLKSPGDK